MDCGIIGLGVMGTSLLKNISNHRNVSIYNRTHERTKEVAKECKCTPFYDLKQFVDSLSKPRKIIIIIASQALDQVLDQLVLDNDDVVIDMGNTFYKETEARMKKYNFAIIGCGISGGEKGALLGPSLMPSGDFEAYKKIEDLLNELNNNKCNYLGEQGCGHFVKMVHNGIEYGSMSIIAEIHMLLRNYMDNLSISAIFKKWNEKHGAYLLEISEIILKHNMFDQVDDVVNNKGTGIWTVMSALKNQINMNILSASMGERMVSHEKDLRTIFKQNFMSNKMNKVLDEFAEKEENNIIEYCYSAYILCTTLSYLQGLNLIQKTSIKNNYNLDMKKVLKAWKHGCIIRSKDIEDLERMIDGYENSSPFVQIYCKNIEGLRMFTVCAINKKCSIPTIMACLAYIDGMGSNVGSILAAMRDCFGAHTVDLIDGKKGVHIDWENKK